MTLKLLCVMPICVGALIAQNTNGDLKRPVATQITRVVRVHGDAFSIANLLGKSGTVEHQATSALRAIVLKGPPPDVEDVERTIQELDSLGRASGSKDVELTAVVIAGSMEPIASAQGVPGEPLLAVTKQLRSIFPYKNYQMLSTTLMRSAQAVKAETAGLMKAVQPLPDRWPVPATYKIMYDSASLSNETPGSVRLANFHFSVSMPVASGPKLKDAPFASTQYQVQNVGLVTDVDLREGQKVVVGNINFADADMCLFVVLSARLEP